MKKFAIVAESVTDEPTVIVEEDSVVVIVGLALTTVNDSQGEVAALLFASPLYAAIKLKLPVELKRTGLLSGTTPFVTVTIDTIVPGAMHTPLAKSV